MRYRSSVFACVLLLIVIAVFPSIGMAANNTTTQETPVQDASEQDGNGILDISEQFQEAISSVLMDLVDDLAEQLNDALSRVFVSYPDVKQQQVLEVHQKVFWVSLAVASAFAVWIGIIRMFNRGDGIRSLMMVLGAVAFGAIAPSLLWYPVELSRLLTEALVPADTNIIEVSRFSLELFLILLIDVFLLLGTVLIFVVRDFYLMFGVAVAPLVALMAATPSLRGFAGKLIRIWIAFLLIGPLDAVVLDLTLSLMGSSVVDVPHYLWGLGGIALLLGLPLILLGAGAVFFAPMTRVVSRGSSKVRRGAEASARMGQDSDQRDDFTDDERDRQRSRRNRFRRNRDDRE